MRVRDETAKRLRKEGHASQADEVKRLAKPSVPVWAVNQLARRRREDVGALVKAADLLREAQAGGRRDFAKVAAAERAAVTKLVEAASEILHESGRPPSDATLNRIAGTLHAAAASDEAQRDLEAGRLTTELEPPGFGALLGFVPETASAEPADEVGRARERRTAREALTDAQKRAENARARATGAEDEAAAARADLDRAEAAAARARSEADDADAEVERAEARLRELERER